MHNQIDLLPRICTGNKVLGIRGRVIRLKLNLSMDFAIILTHHELPVMDSLVIKQGGLCSS